MSKKKLKRFKELESLERVIQPRLEEVYKTEYSLKGKWVKEFFKNNNPITLELGCGKGEYTVNLAKRYPGRNFIGVDIKGARIWKGAKTADELGLTNVAFIRTNIELIESFFTADEVEEIWITFPDPQLKKSRNKKRLTSPRFLNLYRNLLVDKGIIHLKTDSLEMHQYTARLVGHNELEVIKQTTDLYNSGHDDDILSIKTFYEQQFLAEGCNITYISFILPVNKTIEDFPEDEQE